MYERAFNESDKPDMQYYCGINVATLRFLLGRNDYREVAERILRICSDINPKDDVEKNWVFATQGESHLLLRRYDQATRNYQRAMVYDHTEAQAESPRRHALCIFGVMVDQDIRIDENEKKVFEALGLKWDEHFNQTCV